MRPGGTLWTQDETNTVIAMRRAGHRAQDIATVLDRSLDSVASKIANLRSVIDGSAVAVLPSFVCERPVTRAERVTAGLMGDPPPGRSALDQRQA